MKNSKYGQSYSYDSFTLNGKKISVNDAKNMPFATSVQTTASQKNMETAEVEENALEKTKVRELLDENFVLGANVLDSIQSETLQSDFDNMELMVQKLLQNLKTLQPRLTKKIYNTEEYEAHLDEFAGVFESLKQSDNKAKFIEKNISAIHMLVDYFINKHSRIKLHTDDIGFKVNGILDKTLLNLPISKVLASTGGIEKEKRSGVEVIPHNPELENRMLFIPGVNTMKQDASEITSPGFKQKEGGLFGGLFPGLEKKLAKIPFFKKMIEKKKIPYRYENGDKKNAYGNGNNFEGLFETIADDYGYGVDMVNSYYMLERDRVESVIAETQKYLESPEGQKVEVLFAHSYGGLIANSLDLSKTNVKKIITVATPYDSDFVKKVSVPRESWTNRLKKRTINRFTFGLSGDTFIKPETTKNIDGKHAVVDAGDHCEGLYYKHVDKNIIADIMSGADIKKVV